MARKLIKNNNQGTKEFYIKVPEKKNVAIIGGGIFGIFTALKLAERGYKVAIFEKSHDILLGASYVNQNRLHMGYHYPRSEETAASANVYQKVLTKMFKEVAVDNFDHYYCIAKKGSLTSPKEYLAFCDKVGLPYRKEFPKEISVNKNTVALSIKVPEKIYDANLLRKTLTSIIKKDPGTELVLETEVIGMQLAKDGVIIESKHQGKTANKKYDAVVNATYSNLNQLLITAGIEVKEYQYELCEMPVVKVPWVKRTGCAIMDGPFFGILPFGFSEEYLLYDVELSVLERCYGVSPKFVSDVSHYDSEPVRRERFLKYLKKAKKYIPEMADCKHLYSTYVVRMVLPNRDHDDARPTEVFRHGHGVWSIFAGKVSTAIPVSEKIVEEMQVYFNGNKK